MNVKTNTSPTVDYVDWSSLPSELLEKISQGLSANTDYLRLRSVCHNWRSATPPPRYIPSQIPWLMLPSLCNNDTDYGGDFLCLFNNKVCHIQGLPEFARGKRCFGSSHGWLAFVDSDTFVITLFNPLTKAEIQLPEITTVPGLYVQVSEVSGRLEWFWWADDMEEEYMLDFFFVKFMLSDNPCTSNGSYIAMILYSEVRRLAFCKPGDSVWWSVTTDGIEDGIYHKGQFYGIDSYRQLTVRNLDPYDLRGKTIGRRFDFCYSTETNYLVEVSGELMMVIRDIRVEIELNRRHKTICFHVYRFIPASEEWIRVTSLDDYTLFLGMSCSFSFSAKDVIPTGCKPNCIYFSDDIDCWESLKTGDYDAGIFNLEDGSIESLPCCRTGKLWSWSLPIWIAPSLT